MHHEILEIEDMGLSEKITVLIAHSDTLISAGLAAVLGEREGFEVLLQMERNNAPSSLNRGSPVDIAVADYDSGLRLSASSRRGRPRVLILTQRDSEAAICRALELGVSGYLVQGCSVAEIMNGIHQVCRGNIALSPLVASKVAERVKQQSPLTCREEQILRRIMSGLSNKAIALELSVTAGTVKTHVKAIFRKLNAKSRTEAVAVAQRRGILLDEATRLPRGGAPDEESRFRSSDPRG